MKKNLKYPRLILFALITLISAFIFCPYIFSDKAYIVGWDMRTIYTSNFENLRTVLQAWVHDGVRPYWTWYSFLGNDFYSSKLFYFNDFFEFPFALTEMTYEHAIMIMTYIKFLIAGFGFMAYAKYNRYSSRTAVIGSLMFTFSAYHMYVMPHPFFASFFIFLPLYFLSVDRYIRERKTGMFILMVFFMFINNYYQFYSVSLFTIIYYIWRWHREYGTYKDMWRTAFILIGYYMIGFLMSGIVVLPEVLNILANSRVGKRSSTLFYDSIIPYLDYLAGMFVPASAYANRGTPVSSLYTFVTKNDSVMNAYLWATSIPALLFPQLFTKKNRDPLNILFTVLISVTALVPILSSAMHGFSEPSFRWLASPLFLLMVNVLPLLDEPERIDKRLLLTTVIVLTILQIAATPLIALATGTDLALLKEDMYLWFIFAPGLILTGYLLYTGRYKALPAAAAAELCVVAYFSFFGSPALSDVTKQINDRVSYLMGEKDEYNRYTRSLDPANADSFYRNYIDPVNIYWGLSTSYNLDFNIMGMLAYDSTYLPSMNDLIRLDPERVQDYLPWTFDIQNPDVMNLISTKYAVVMDESEVPFENYRFAGNYYAMSVYENLDYVNLGKTYTSLMTYDDYDPSMSGKLADTIICHAEDAQEISSLLGSETAVCGIVKTEGNYLYADIETTEPGFAVLSVPYDEGWHVSRNGQPVKAYKVSGGMTGLAVEAGFNEIEMNFSPRGLKTGAMISAAGLLLFIAAMITQRVLKKKQA